jgi:hypothetical protein
VAQVVCVSVLLQQDSPCPRSEGCTSAKQLHAAARLCNPVQDTVDNQGCTPPRCPPPAPVEVRHARCIPVVQGGCGSIILNTLRMFVADLAEHQGMRFTRAWVVRVRQVRHVGCSCQMLPPDLAGIGTVRRIGLEGQRRRGPPAAVVPLQAVGTGRNSWYQQRVPFMALSASWFWEL